MGNKMDIDSTPNTSESKEKKQKIPGPEGNSSASAETSSKYPNMELAQNIHRLIMINDGTLDSNMMKALEIPSDLKEIVLKEILEDLENPSLYRYLTSHISQLIISDSASIMKEESLKAME